MSQRPEEAALEQALAYEFRDKSLLTLALTHRSYRNEHQGTADNERLEFLGDAAIDLWVAQLLYDSNPDAPEGELTRLRADLVRAEGLTEVALELGIGEAILLGKGEEASGGREKVRLLSSTLEALMGAVLQDGGPEASEAAVRHLFAGRAGAATLRLDAKSRLQELAQRDGQAVRYELTHVEGPDHARTFFVEVHLDDEVVAKGEGSSKQSAEQMAATGALKAPETP